MLFMASLLCCVASVFIVAAFLQLGGAHHNLIASMREWENSME
jgi:hypothetical protein